MKIIYHMPSLDSIYAYRTIYHGYKNAFEDLGHQFFTLTADNDLAEMLVQVRPDIFITSSHFYHQKYLDLALLKKYRDQGMVLFTKIGFWNAPQSLKFQLNEPGSLRTDRRIVENIKNNLLGDIYFTVVEPDDERMTGFKEETGRTFETIPLAADKLIMQADYDAKFAADISYIGTYLPAKSGSFTDYLFPLRQKYHLKIYGQDWTRWDRILGKIQRAGQFFNLPYLRALQKPKLHLTDEAKIYSSSTVSVNIHESHQRQLGGDCNERTFKIPLCGGFEITDDVACIRKYFKDNEEIIIAQDKNDWFEKIAYYLAHPEERRAISAAGRQRVLRDHTYHNRVNQIIKLYDEYKRK